MAKPLTPRKVGEELGISHVEVIRRIRRGQIRAEKLDGGWYWVVEPQEVARVKRTGWYTDLLASRERKSAAT